MKISKNIMNPARVSQLKVIAEVNDEMNDMYLANKSHIRLEQARLSVQRFRELGLIKNVGGGYFVVSDKGKQYLNEAI